MIKININQELLDKHINQINKKLIKKLDNINIEPLSKNTICCLDEIYSNSKLILGANSVELKKIIAYFEENFYCSIGYDENKNTELYLVLSEIFIDESSGLYKNFTSYKKEYDAYKFVKSLDLKTCPYCNRNYTFTVDEDSGKLRPEIDHFYPKSIYPFLAMSFYNLIPSCPICNHTKSSKISNDLINPYDIKKNDFKFTYKPTDITFTQIDSKKYNTNSFEIEFKSSNKNIETFKLDELYKQHKDVVIDLLMKKAYYPKSYMDELEKNFGFTQDEIYRYLLGNYKKEEDLHKRPLSKLIKDISEELDLI